MPRRLLVPGLIALAAAAFSAWIGTAAGWEWTDYDSANAKPFTALTHGHLGSFFSSAPIEGPSLLLRAPFALIATLWNGDNDSIWQLVAIPGLAAGAALGVLLFELRGRLWPAARWPMLYLLLAAANPLTLRALEQGHPEELMGAVFCVVAVLAALHDRRTLAAVLLGVAVANKAWAVLAVGPVLLALDGGRLRALLTAGGVGLLLVAPYVIDAKARSSLALAAGTDEVFQPWQAWWFLGDHDHVVRGAAGTIKPGYRNPPGWIEPVTHPLVAALVVPAGLAWSRLRRGRSGDLLLLLTTLLLARCVLDVADTAYYHLPFLIALLAWEAVRSARPPILTLTASALVWLTTVKLPLYVDPDVQSFLYVAWAVPALLVLVRATFWAPQPRPAVRLLPA